MKKFSLAKYLVLAMMASFLLAMNSVTVVAAEDGGFDDLPNTQNVFTNMSTQLNQFERDGEIQEESAVRALNLHLTSIEHFQTFKMTDKVVKHTQGLKRLLKHQQNEGVISENVFNVFNTYAEYLIGKQERPFDSDKAMEHIKNLSVDIGPREAGSEAEKEGVEYIEREMNRYGYDTTIEEAPRSDRINPQLEIVSDDNEEIPLRVATGSPETDEDGINGNIYDAGTGQPDDFDKEADGQIALMKDGEIPVHEKAQNAENAGAIAVVIYDNNEDYALPFLALGDYESSIPVVGITKANGESLLTQMSEDEMEASLSIQTLTDQTTKNVIAAKKPDDIEDPEIVYVGSHLDSVPFAPGANDDASGTATLMELARVFKDYDGDKELRFAAFGGEELGFVGSRYHVNHLSQDEIDRTQVQFQMDMVGTSWVPASELLINTVDGESNLVSESTHEAADRLNMDKSLLPLHKLSRSDHVPFHEEGVDSALFIWMEPGTPPGAAHIEPYYHSPEDKFKHISPERVQLSGDVVFNAISDLVDFQPDDNDIAPIMDAS